MSHNIDQIKKEVSPVLSEEVTLVVNNPDQYISAADFLKRIKFAQKRVIDFFSPMKSRAHEAHKAITLSEKMQGRTARARLNLGQRPPGASNWGRF